MLEHEKERIANMEVREIMQDIRAQECSRLGIKEFKISYDISEMAVEKLKEQGIFVEGRKVILEQ